MTISLTAKDGSFAATIRSGDVALANALKSGKFSFKDVPTETTMHLELTYRAAQAGSARWFGTFVFHLPAWPRSDSKLKKAGYLGDFEIDVARAKIQYEDRYEG